MEFTQKQIENRNAWVQELRSGKHGQTTNLLKREEADGTCKYCCLGVAAEMVLGREFYRDGNYLRYTDEADYTVESMLTGIDKEAMGIEHMHVLTALNDGHRWSFDMIADYIEAETMLGRTFNYTEGKEEEDRIDNKYRER